VTTFIKEFYYDDTNQPTRYDTLREQVSHLVSQEADYRHE